MFNVKYDTHVRIYNTRVLCLVRYGTGKAVKKNYMLR